MNPDTGEDIEDENKSYWVICKNEPGNIEILGKIKGKLKQLFAQDDIMLYYIEVERL